MLLFDSLINKLFEINKEVKSNIVDSLKEVYFAGDVDGDGSIGKFFR